MRSTFKTREGAAYLIAREVAKDEYLKARRAYLAAFGEDPDLFVDRDEKSRARIQRILKLTEDFEKSRKLPAEEFERKRQEAFQRRELKRRIAANRAAAIERRRNRHK